jgi:isoleucyl-tRNA synthetase
MAEWEQLLTVRAAVNAALEHDRQIKKTIGNSLMAAVDLRASGELLTLLRKYEAWLPTIFIVSEVTLAPSDGDLTVQVRRSSGTKCERCWRYVADISRAAGREGLCDRCVSALAEA